MTVNVCLVCLNHFNNELSSVSSDTEQNDNSLIRKKFLKFAQNYLQLSSDTADHFPKIFEKESFCEKCELAVISPICQVYQEYLSTQLRLSWELGQLAKLLDNSKHSTGLKESRFSKLKSLSLQLGIDGVFGVNEFRALLTEKCYLKRNETLSFIPLKRCKTPTKTTAKLDSAFQNSCKNSATVPVSQDEDNMKIETDSAYGDNDTDCPLSDPLAIDEPDSMHLPENGGPIPDYPKSCSPNEEGFEMDVEKRLMKIKICHDADEDQRLVQTREEIDIDNDTKLEMRIIQNEEKFICPQCPANFPRRANLNIHLAKTHPSLEQQYKGKTCQICWKKFPTRTQLRNHVRCVHVGRRHNCSFCNASFKLEFHLKQHIATIHKPKPASCKLCGKILKHSKYLKVHMAAVHPDPANQLNWPKCPKCKKSFFRKSNLQKHMRICI
ncbi:unnamed protein product [Orchesella dallaii]|uniref:C2H2-type domain-containing protein n=1 Tax=Orchesella dallaii TaxID=48710 RepID=A0ABP1RWB9_9HEXA